MPTKKYAEFSNAVRSSRVTGIVDEMISVGAPGPFPLYDKNGKRITLDTWASLNSDKDYKIVAFTKLDRAEVSTVWLGLDHNFMGSPPLIFETMVFPECDICQRYHTFKEAVIGHKKIVKFVCGQQKKFGIAKGEIRTKRVEFLEFLELEVKDDRVDGKANVKSRDTRRVLEILD